MVKQIIIGLLLVAAMDASAMQKGEPRPVPTRDEFVSACICGGVEKVQRLLAAGANVNSRSWHRHTVLIEAAMRGHNQVVEVLIEKGVELDAINCFGNTALIEAALYGDADIVVNLLVAGADVSIRSKHLLDGLYNNALMFVASENGDTALSLAQKRGHVAVVYAIESHIRWKSKLDWCKAVACVARDAERSASVATSLGGESKRLRIEIVE